MRERSKDQGKLICRDAEKIDMVRMRKAETYADESSNVRVLKFWSGNRMIQAAPTGVKVEVE